MLKRKQSGKEQYVQGIDGKLYHIYNVATLNALMELGIVDLKVAPEIITSVELDSGKEIVVLEKE